jgi:hypothetical protein
MLGWLQDLSTWSLALLCSLFFVALTWAGTLFVRPFFRLWLRNQPGANDLVSYTSAGFSLLYGLLLGLLSVATYQNSEKIATHVEQEATRLALVYRGSDDYPEPLRSELQYLLRDYTLFVVNKDWPAHQNGKIPNGGLARLAAIRQNLFAFEPETKTQEFVHQATLTNFDSLVEARVERTSGVNTTIPGVFWYVVLIGALINIVLVWMLQMRLMPHLLLGGLVSFFLGVMIFLIIAMDEPLRGAVSVPPSAYELVYRVVMQPDESA